LISFSRRVVSDHCVDRLDRQEAGAVKLQASEADVIENSFGAHAQHLRCLPPGDMGGARMSFSIELHCPLGDAKDASFIKATIPLLSAMDDMTADWHDEGADRAADVMRRKAMLCHGHSPPS
jgi:hypothetical protein